MTTLKTSLLVNKQIPEFIREDNPKFVHFLEAYYEFLETQQGTQKNDLISKAKDLRYIQDVDYSLEAFEEHFFNVFLSKLPRDVEVNKALLIKNIMPLYLAKGSESSFKLLFRLLFDEEVELECPKNNILIASSGNWTVNNILQVRREVYTKYVGDGETTVFKLSQQASSDEISVYVDGEIVSDYSVYGQYYEIKFDSAPAENSVIEVLYDEFDETTLVNRKVTGVRSGATALVERAELKSVAGNFYIQIYISPKTLVGSFLDGESISSEIIVDETFIDVSMQTTSGVSKITVIDGGSSYNVGDPVLVRGIAVRDASAIVDDVASGLIEDVRLVDGGSGFQVGDRIEAVGIDISGYESYVTLIDDSGTSSLNTVNFYTDVVTPYSDVVLSDLYGFPVDASANVDSVISTVLANTTIQVGSIVNFNVANSIITAVPTFNALGPVVNDDNPSNIIRLNSLGIIGEININNGGSGYAIGEYLTFTNPADVFTGRGANAVISNVSTSGAITQITINNGGVGYYTGNFPSVSVDTVAGVSANLRVGSILGDGESIIGYSGELAAGQILSISVLDHGIGYASVPVIDLSGYGDGNATGNVEIETALNTTKGRWINSDGLLSTEETRLEGRDYYVNYSYVLKSKVAFSKFRSIFRDLIHPSGFLEYSQYKIESVYGSDYATREVVTISNVATQLAVSGTVNINSSIYIVGTNTKFEVAETLGILSVGANVAVNTEIRTISSIISNTVLEVSDAFTVTSNNETLVIYS
jgi:hypothetical protein